VHRFGKPDRICIRVRKLDPDPHQNQIQKQDPDPVKNPHQSQKSGAVDVQRGAVDHGIPQTLKMEGQ
jgi:hypothetical protein